MLSPHSADSGQALAVPVRVLDGTEAHVLQKAVAALEHAPAATP
jgi:hypothetical protein